MKKLFLLLLLAHSLLLGACATVPKDAEEIQAQSQLIDRRTRTVIAVDKAIETEAYSELNSDSELRDQCHITINAYNAAVLVAGEVLNEELSKKVITAVQGIANVKLVHNNLSLAYPTDAATRNNDIVITDTVKKALGQIRTMPDFSSSMVKVITENGTVYLMGQVHRDEGTVVINVTRLQPGIKEIITVFEYLD